MHRSEKVMVSYSNDYTNSQLINKYLILHVYSWITSYGRSQNMKDSPNRELPNIDDMPRILGKIARRINPSRHDVVLTNSA